MRSVDFFKKKKTKKKERKPSKKLVKFKSLLT